MHDLCECALRIINASQCEQHHPQVVERSETRRLVLVELEGAPNVDDGFGNLSTNQESGSQRMLGVRLDFSLFSCPRFRRDLVERLLGHRQIAARLHRECAPDPAEEDGVDRKSTRLNSSHVAISYAVFCLKKKNIIGNPTTYRQ